MRKISKPVMDKLLEEKQICYRDSEGTCEGRMTLDHTLTYGGGQIDEAWAILWTCAFHHDVDEFQGGGNLDREKSIWFALNKATDEELRQYSKAINYIELRKRLNKKYLEIEGFI